MHERFKTAGAALALTLAMGLPIPGLGATEQQTSPEKLQTGAMQDQTKPPETPVEVKEPNPAMEDTAPESADTAPSNGMKTFDALAVRPVTFVSSVFSAGAFVLALPFVALDPAMDVEKTRKNLVEEPFQDTFQRPLGDFNGSAW